YTRHDSLLLIRALSKDPDFRWCLNIQCNSGHVHVSDGNQNIFTCRSCGAKACTIHDIVFHDGETCEQYDARMEQEDDETTRRRKEQNQASEKTLKRISKSCPNSGCGSRIEKI
ncbi:hypothetical protein BS50DRAFT_485185, partial [Corynespora cassiicola Philippines]